MKAELLAPAGSPEALRAAIKAGADAVYLGAAAHGARATAGFDDPALEQAIRLAHLYGRRVYVTVNTLIKQDELPAVRLLLRRLLDLRADAVIVQDVGLARLIRAEFPGLCLHASTQMSVHNASGARVLQKMGVSRVVLARECSLQAIRAVAETGLETEVFIHGAMCVSVSGQCLFSSQIGGRSGNRGKCAQPCRLQYSYRDQAGALLSMRDLNTLERLPELLEAGARYFKIEGRLKRSEYVYTVTALYREALDLAVRGLPLSGIPERQEALEQAFSRGFTAGHAFSQQDSALITVSHTGHLGLPLGTILSARQRDGFVLADIRLKEALNNGDGLQVRGSLEQDCIYSGPAVPKDQQATLRLRDMPAKGDAVWRLQDERRLAQAREQAGQLPELVFDAALVLAPGQPAGLQVSHQGIRVQVSGELVQAAQQQPLDSPGARRLLARTGGTPFTLGQFSLNSPAPAFLPVSALNALRREALALLEEAVIRAHALPAPAPAHSLPGPDPVKPLVWTPRLCAILPPGLDPDALREAGAEVILHCPDNYREGQLRRQLAGARAGDFLLLPRQITDRDLDRALSIAAETGLSVMADNLGQLLRGAGACNEGVPAFNDQALRFLAEQGISAAVLPRELSLKEALALPRDLVELILPVYGRAQLMQLNHCPERLRRGLDRNKAGCAFCQRGEGVKGQALLDRFQARYPLGPTHFDDTCLIALYHHTALNLSGLAPRALSWLMDLRLDDQEAALSAARHYAALLRGGSPAAFLPMEPGRTMLGVD